MRDIFQVFSFLISLLTLLIIIRKMRRGVGSRFVWLPFAIITICTLIYYLLVFIDANIRDIINASDVSATLRLTVQITLLLYAWYMPITHKAD